MHGCLKLSSFSFYILPMTPNYFTDPTSPDSLPASTASDQREAGSGGNSFASLGPNEFIPLNLAIESMPEASNSIYEGALEKRNINMQFKERYAIMTRNTLYFSRLDMASVVDEILLLQIKEVSARHQPTGLSAHFNSSADDAIDCVIPKNCTQTIVEQERCFEIHTIEGGRGYMLKAPSMSERDKWVAEIEQAMQAERKREESELYRTWPRRLQRHIRRAYESDTFQVCVCVYTIWCH